LFDETNGPTSFGGAVVALAVVRGAVECGHVSGIPVGAAVCAVVSGIAVRIAADENFEVGAAAAVDPDTARFLAPRAAFDALGFAVTFYDTNRAMRTGVAGVAVHVVGIARDTHVVRLLLFVGIGVAADCKLSAAAAVHPNAAVIVPPG